MNLYICYQKLYDLTIRQRDSLDQDDFDSLLIILEEKQKLIEEIEQYNIEEYIKRQSKPAEMLDNIKKLLKKIKELEKENENELRKKQSDLLLKINCLNKNQKGRKGYQGNMKYDAKFIDKKG
ncbi:MAG: hypothetical protein ACOCRO_02930 [Halanaerobiales bacterium]